MTPIQPEDLATQAAPTAAAAGSEILGLDADLFERLWTECLGPAEVCHCHPAPVCSCDWRQTMADRPLLAVLMRWQQGLTAHRVPPALRSAYVAACIGLGLHLSELGGQPHSPRKQLLWRTCAKRRTRLVAVHRDLVRAWVKAPPPN